MTLVLLRSQAYNNEVTFNHNYYYTTLLNDNWLSLLTDYWLALALALLTDRWLALALLTDCWLALALLTDRWLALLTDCWLALAFDRTLASTSPID